MKRLLGMLSFAVLVFACQENEPIANDFTGNEITYPLLQGSTYPINGTVSFKEKKDGTALVRVELSGTDGNLQHPVHLHMGNISTPDADVTALLNPVLSKTGISETHLVMLADETEISYKQLLQMNACIKVHLSASGPEKDIVLAGGNIGTAVSDDFASGRAGISVCKSE